MFLASLFVLSSPRAFAANECWAVSVPKGYSAYADQNYNFVEDGLPNPILVCFGTDTGTVTGTDTQLVKFGNSTLAGYATNQGIELFEVYQIDRINSKLLYTKSRIGTKTAFPLFSDLVSSFIGDAKMLPAKRVYTGRPRNVRCRSRLFPNSGIGVKLSMLYLPG